ncbi:MAG: mechanosensitive ion channel family protein [Bacteroidales bacterium]
MIAKPKFKVLKLRFLSVSVIVTSLALILLQVGLYLNGMGFIHLPPGVVKVLASISLVIATFFATSLLLRLSIRRVFNLFEEPEERIFYSKIYSWTVYSIGLFVVLHHFGVSLGNITLFVGLLATGLAFAVRDVLLSFFGWMILLQKKPFRIGDYIRIGEDEGKVLHIGTFYVLLDKTQELPEDFTRVPNRLFLEKSISILGKNVLHEVIRFPLITLEENHRDKEHQLLLDLREMLQDKTHIKVYTDIKEDKLVLVVEYLVNFEQRAQMRAEVIRRVVSGFSSSIRF